MVLSAAQTRTFFENEHQIGLSRRTKDHLISEGISSIEDLGEWDDNDWDVFVTSCRKPKQIEDPANAGNLIKSATFCVVSKVSQTAEDCIKVDQTLRSHFDGAYC